MQCSQFGSFCLPIQTISKRETGKNTEESEIRAYR